MRILLGLLIFITSMPAHAQTMRSQLIELTNAIRTAEKQDEAVNEQLQNLRDEEAALTKELVHYRYETAKIYHALESMRQSPQKNIYLLPDTHYLDHFYELRHTETLKDIMLHHINRQTTALLDLQEKQNRIADYLQRRELLELTVNASLDQLKEINQNRPKKEYFQIIINELSQENETLDDFLKSILNLPDAPALDDTPLVFSMPVSGIVTQQLMGIEIEAAPQSLVTTPARGTVVFADNFKRLGKIVIINHGQGYISILKNLGDIFVEEGFKLENGEPIGILSQKSQDNLGNNTMLYYELRYNDSIINPIEKLTGL